MLRRNARLRREFLFRKSLEGKEKELYEKKRKIRQALEGAFWVPGTAELMLRAGGEGKPIPSELRREEAELRHQVELEDDNTAVPRTHIDDEYAHAGERDPKILITTSRDPSSRLVQFAKEVKLLFPNSQRVNRGGMMPKGAKSITLKECGPRFELKLYQIKLGTLDQPHAENEFVLRSYTNSAKRSKLATAEDEEQQ
ncbi:hypothetical protein CHLNCDRAFT_51897 [Chlorella variabilis]|uniref:Brix domain-containing protein n=1 Tax=Chlorella variabilis TaxID=554065 RepID=E1ZDJ0_CHLVA|nr:hypothetical protein CHLNCDRAFT_51897 [Chlorella variabilis]EFN56422.1 hypothetical protein CHLNCDRAFT_51897 [Chlorella variabilis]|eukprot:XP_005848524.1 hypothetical protein CHLNCDRAFT_51897 [Chlorella variabilis]